MTRVFQSIYKFFRVRVLRKRESECVEEARADWEIEREKALADLDRWVRLPSIRNGGRGYRKSVKTPCK